MAKLVVQSDDGTEVGSIELAPVPGWGTVLEQRLEPLISFIHEAMLRDTGDKVEPVQWKETHK